MVIANTTMTDPIEDASSKNPFQEGNQYKDYIASLPTPDPPLSFWQATSDSRLDPGVFHAETISIHSDSDSDSDSEIKEGTRIGNQHDLLIIGGGMSGVSAAYHAAHRLPSNSNSDSEGNKTSFLVLEARSFCGGATGRNGGHLTPASAIWYSDLNRNPQSYLLKNIDPKEIQREEVYGNDVGTKSDEVIRKMLTLEQRTSGELIMLIRSEEAKKRRAEMKRKAMERFNRNGNGNGSTDPSSSSSSTNGVDNQRGESFEEIDVELVSGSNWYVCFTKEEEKLCDESLEKAKRAGLSDMTRNIKKLSKEEIDQKLSNPPNVVTVYEQQGATVHPINLVRLIWKAALTKAEERGISLKYITHSPVTKVEELKEEKDFKVKIDSKIGELKSKNLIHSTNGYISNLITQLSGKIIPTRAQVVAVQPNHSSQESIPDWEMGMVSNQGFEYSHQRSSRGKTLDEEKGKSPLIIFGGGRWKANGMEWGKSNDEEKDEKISEFLHSYLPNQFPNSLSKSKVSMEWTGITGFTSTSDPLVGPLLKDFSEGSKPEVIEGQYISAGFSGHGMTRCYSTSEILIELIVSKALNQKFKAPNWFPLCYLTCLPNEIQVDEGELVVKNGR